MKRIYLQPSLKVIQLTQTYHLCEPSIVTERVGPDEKTIPADGPAPTREFDWEDYDGEE